MTRVDIQFISPAVNVQDPVIPPGQLAVFVKQNGTQTGVDIIQLGTIKDISGLSFNYQQRVFTNRVFDRGFRRTNSKFNFMRRKHRVFIF